MFNATPSLSDIAAVTRGNDDNLNGGGWWVLILLFAIFGWGRGGYGDQGGGSVPQNYALATDFATLERKLDGVNSGLCDGFYAQNTNMLTGFGNLANAITQQGYETRLGQNMLQQQIADCCCTTQSSIKDVGTQTVMNTAAIQEAIKDCCCQNEKLTMQAAFTAQQNHCQTLQAIDGLGDRLIDYMNQQEMARLREENQSYRLAASQQVQNNYLINALRPTPIPSYEVANPWAPSTTA